MQATAQARDEIDTTLPPEASLSVVAETAPEASTAALLGGGDSVPAPRGGLRRRFERFRGDADAVRAGAGAGEDVDQELTVMLLREENARLKAERHRPSDVGSMVDRMRVVAVDEGHGEALDDVWGLLSECLAIREGLDHACEEIHAAISSVQERLTRLRPGSQHLAAGLPVTAAPPAIAAPAPPAAARVEGLLRRAAG